MTKPTEPRHMSRAILYVFAVAIITVIVLALVFSAQSTTNGGTPNAATRAAQLVTNRFIATANDPSALATARADANCYPTNDPTVAPTSAPLPAFP